MRARLNAVAVGVFLSVFSALALAIDPPATLADLTGVISFTTASAAVLAVALVVINFKVIKQGARIVVGMIGWAR